VLKKALERLGLRQVDLAKLVDVSPRTVSHWATGAKPLPATVSGYLRLLEKAAPEVRSSELQRLDDRVKQLDEGIYRIAYRMGDGEEHALAVLRNGKIAGVDRHGDSFGGTYRFDRARGSNTVCITLNMPEDLADHPAAKLFGPAGLDITVMIDRPAPVSRVAIAIAGQSVPLEISYIGPLPS